MNAAMASTATGVAAVSRRPWYSTLPSFEPAVADGDAVRDADELEVGEHHAGTLAAVVEQHLDARRGELVVQPIGQRLHRLVAVVADRRDRDREGRHRRGPDDAARVVVLLDRGGDDPGHADAVAAHLHQLRLALRVEIGGTHRLGVHVAQREDVADLDAAQDLERPLAVGRRVAGDDVAQVGDEVGLAAVAAEIDAGEVEVRLRSRRRRSRPSRRRCDRRSAAGPAGRPTGPR